MGILALAADERVAGVEFTNDTLSVALMDGRTITAPLAWYPRLLNATKAQRKNWQIAGGGYGIHWPDIDEDLSTEGLLRGAPAPDVSRRDPEQETPTAYETKLTASGFRPQRSRRLMLSEFDVSRGARSRKL